VATGTRARNIRMFTQISGQALRFILGNPPARGISRSLKGQGLGYGGRVQG
jgi:hypothetical protein